MAEHHVLAAEEHFISAGASTVVISIAASPGKRGGVFAGGLR
jgi:hypothetical protein